MPTTTKDKILTGGWDKIALEGAVMIHIDTAGSYAIDPPGTAPSISRGIPFTDEKAVSAILAAAEAMYVKGDVGVVLTVIAEQHA